MTFNGKINGKKRYIVGGGLVLGIPTYFLMQFIMNMNTTVISNDNQLKTNTTELVELKKTPAQIARIEENVKNINKNFGEFKTEQKEANGEMLDTLNKIYQEIK